MIRIIGGKSKGRTLLTPPKNSHVRPILARIKKSLFDILRPAIPNSKFLDMYAGTGAVGIEALSRGAQSVVFVENNSDCAKVIRDNLDLFGFISKGTIYRVSATGDLSLLPKPFDIIFMGPPYKDAEKKPLALVNPTLENISAHQLLAPKGIVIAQHHLKEQVTATEQWTIMRQEKYGDTIVTFFKPSLK